MTCQFCQLFRTALQRIKLRRFAGTLAEEQDGIVIVHQSTLSIAGGSRMRLTKPDLGRRRLKHFGSLEQDQRILVGVCLKISFFQDYDEMLSVRREFGHHPIEGQPSVY